MVDSLMQVSADAMGNPIERDHTGPGSEAGPY